MKRTHSRTVFFLTLGSFVHCTARLGRHAVKQWNWAAGRWQQQKESSGELDQTYFEYALSHGSSVGGGSEN